MKKEFQVPSDLELVSKASADVLAFLKPLKLDEGEVFDIRLCLEEALINAMKYGNRLDKDVPVKLTAGFDDGSVEITIEDQGPGFDVRRLKDCTQDENALRNHGRGVHLMQQLMDEVKYNDRGNRVLMVKHLKHRREHGR